MFKKITQISKEFKNIFSLLISLEDQEKNIFHFYEFQIKVIQEKKNYPKTLQLKNNNK